MRQQAVAASRRLLWLTVLALVAACAAPYKLTPHFHERRDQIGRIGFYPLIYEDDGAEHRLYGMTFHRMFYAQAAALPMLGSVRFEEPDSVIAILEVRGVSLRDSVLVPDMLGPYFPAYAYPPQGALRQISDRVDAVVVPRLLSYNEVAAGEQIVQETMEVFAACILPWYAPTPTAERNRLVLRFDLLDAAAGGLLWTYTARFSGGYGQQREPYTRRAVEGFAKHFPFSAMFKGK